MGTAGAVTTGRRIRGLDADQRQAQRRQQLLDAALALIASQGYANTSIEQICQTAYVGTKGFYELFDSKESCYLALLDETIGRVGERMVAALRQAPADEDEAIRALAGTFAHAVADDPRVARATFGQTGSISPAVDRYQREARRWGAHFIEHAWRRYGLVCPPAEELHPVAVGVVGGSLDLVVDWLHDQDDQGHPPGDIDALIDALTGFHTLVRAGLASRGSSED
jgi:AcrR family transcriptional regulator